MRLIKAVKKSGSSVACRHGYEALVFRKLYNKVKLSYFSKTTCCVPCKQCLVYIYRHLNGFGVWKTHFLKWETIPGFLEISRSQSLSSIQKRTKPKPVFENRPKHWLLNCGFSKPTSYPCLVASVSIYHANIPCSIPRRCNSVFSVMICYIELNPKIPVN